MIGYITLGSNDLTASAAFYDPVLAPLGAIRAYTLDTMIAWSFGEKRPLLCAVRPFDAAPASAGNGTMIALAAPDRAVVDRVHRLALDHGATDEGTPGLRGERFYAGYFRDPDGIKLNVFVRG